MVVYSPPVAAGPANVPDVYDPHHEKRSPGLGRGFKWVRSGRPYYSPSNFFMRSKESVLPVMA